MGKRKNPAELPPKVHQEIVALCRDGDRLADSGETRAAIKKYLAAWELIPEDKESWEASTWVLGAAGEAYFNARMFDKALSSFRSALNCPGGLGNPYIHLRVGECFFETNELHWAGDQLMQAYMGAGEEIFEKEDPKYRAYLATLMLPPEVR